MELENISLSWFYNVTVEYRIGMKYHEICVPVLARTKNKAIDEAITYVQKTYVVDSISNVHTIQLINAL